MSGPSANPGNKLTRIKNPILLVITTLAASAEALSQGVHYTYPFSIGCPEERVLAGAVVSIDAKFEGGYKGENYSPPITGRSRKARSCQGREHHQYRLIPDRAVAT